MIKFKFDCWLSKEIDDKQQCAKHIDIIVVTKRVKKHVPNVKWLIKNGCKDNWSIAIFFLKLPSLHNYVMTLALAW
jgi:hypothetical protein